AVSCLYAWSLWLALPESLLLGALAVLLGLGGVTASAWIYRVPARPAWQSKHTVAEFFLSGALLGPLFVGSTDVALSRPLLFVSIAAAGAQLLNQAVKFLWMTASDSFELQATARLLSTRLASRFLVRGAFLIAGGIALPLFSSKPLLLFAALVMALAGEILGRYLFFVSVVPKNLAASYLGGKEAA